MIIYGIDKAKETSNGNVGRLSWTISNFSKLDIKKLYSDIFYAGGYKWRIAIFPKGNEVDHLSIYLDFADSKTPGWTVKLNIEEDDKDKHELSDQKSAFVKADTSTSLSFSEYDALFIGIQKQLEGESFKSDNITSSGCPPSWTVEEIAYAKKILKQCLDIDLDNVIQLGRDFELKKSLSILLSSNAFPENMEDEITKYVANFVQSCEQYEVAKQDLREVQENEKSIEILKTDMKNISSEYFPLRNQAEVVDNEIAELEIQLSERKMKNKRLSKMLEVLAGRATTSKQALVSAEQDHEKLSVLKKVEAEKVIGDMKRSWESLKLGYSNMLV
ncbi:hypothetical protein CsatB_011148 [Cannabis sativa]